MKSLTCLILISLIGSINAQGITNTLGGNTANDKFIVENSDSEACIVVTGDGKVGIGIETPGTSLHIRDDAYGILRLESTNGAYPSLDFWDNATHGGKIESGPAGFYIFNIRPANLNLGTNYSVRMTIDGVGNVGIGTTDPDAKLDVAGSIKSHGDLVVYGAYRGNIGPNNGAPFPRPAYDSGWRDIDPYGTQPGNGNIDLTHSLGGDPDNYVVDLGFMSETGYRDQNVFYSVWNIGDKRNRSFGAYWYSLTDTKISVWRQRDDYRADKVRVRIWVYN